MKLSKIALCMAIAGFGSPAFAQQSEQSDTTASEKVEKIEITGSRIKRINIEGSLPVTIISRAEIDAQGISSAEQLLSQLNIASNGADNLSSNAGIVSGEARGNNGVSGANLRGQGADATLVLLNGRRVATHGLVGRSVDLNSIPFAALERVEVLRDGASAVYGTDAIGGVINFITKKDYEGAQASAFADATEAGGGNIYRVNLLGGTGDYDNDGYNVFASLSYKQNKRLMGVDRDFTNTFQPDRGLSPDTRGPVFATAFNRAGSLLGSGLTDPDGGGNVTAINILNLPGGAGCDSFPLMGPYAYDLWSSSSSKYACAWDYPRSQAIQQPQDSLDFVGRASFKVSADHEAFVEFVASDVDVAKSFEPYQISPGSTFGLDSWYPSTGAAYDMVYDALAGYFDESQMNYGDPIAYRWRCMACGNREIETNTKAYRLLLGMEGTILGDWDYSIGLSRAQNESTSKLGSGYYFTSGLVSALGGGNINPFLLPGEEQTSQAMQDLANVSAEGVKLYGGRTLLTTIDGSISGDLGIDLPGGAIQVATGFDLRREEYKFNGDDRADQQSIYLAPFDNVNALDNVSRDIKAVYAEFYLPVLENFDISLAGRYDHYSGFGGTTNPKVSFSYRPVETVVVRGAYSTGFKVPSFNQLFNGLTESQYTGLDLADPETCPSGIADETTPGCERIQPVEVTGGKEDLVPEESKQSSFGFVFAPTADFNISLDWWNIERTNTIRSAPRDVLIENYELFKDNWIRDSSGEVVAIDRRYINSGGTKTSGIEVDSTLMGDLYDGKWSIHLNGSYLTSFKSKGLEVLPYSDNLVGEYVRYNSLPLKWKHTISFNYAVGDWTHSLTQIYRAGYKDEEPVSVANDSYIPPNWNPDVDAYLIYNYSVSYSGIENTALTFGIKNLFDQDPPFTAHQNDYSAGAAWEPRVADARGRAYTLIASYNF
jgi:iron complex outermembrane recepter protein